MPKVALADTFDDWDSLLRAAEEFRDQKGMHEHLDKLQAAYDGLRGLEAERAALQARQQQATHEMVTGTRDWFSSTCARSASAAPVGRPPPKPSPPPDPPRGRSPARRERSPAGSHTSTKTRAATALPKRQATVDS
jgi:hypothetical protein